MTPSAFSRRSSRRNRKAPAWDCRSAGGSSRLMAAVCGRAPTRKGVRHFSSRCLLMRRRHLKLIARAGGGAKYLGSINARRGGFAGRDAAEPVRALTAAAPSMRHVAPAAAHHSRAMASPSAVRHGPAPRRPASSRPRRSRDFVSYRSIRPAFCERKLTSDRRHFKAGLYDLICSGVSPGEPWPAASARLINATMRRDSGTSSPCRPAISTTIP